MIIRRLSYLCILTVGIFGLAGCIGYDIPHVFQRKPWSLIQGGDQLGRDQLANRFLVSQQAFPMKGLNPNEVLTILGEPQQIEVKEYGISEDWYYVYYKRYKTWPKTPKGTFLVRFHQEKVIDVVKLQ